MSNDFVLSFCDDNLKQLLFDIQERTIKISDPIYNYDTNYPLHQFAFENDLKHFGEYYSNNKDCDLNKQDELGNTPLIIAAMKGNEDILKLLIFLDANITLKNKDGWTALHEAISYGNVNQVHILFLLSKSQSSGLSINMENKISILESSRDFIIDFKWVIETWVPILSRYLPSDNCTLMKYKDKLRFDSTLLDFKNRTWIRGNVSCLINPELGKTIKGCPEVYLIHHEKKIYQSLSESDNPDDIFKELALLMSSDLVDLSLNMKQAHYDPRTRFWPFTSEIVKEKIGDFNADMYELSEVQMIIKKRKEHMDQDKINYYKHIKSKLQEGHLDILEKSNVKLSDTKPPTPNDVNWQHYKESMLNCERMDIGRPQICKENVKEFKLVIGMSEEYPLTTTEIIDVLQIVLPLKRLSKLRDIFETNLPNGFPVYIEVPVFPTTTARVSFQHAQVGSPNLDMDPSLFELPSSYKRVKNIIKSCHKKSNNNDMKYKDNVSDGSVDNTNSHLHCG